MPTYNYKAVDQKGLPAQGQLDASNDIDLELRLDRIGLSLLTFREAKKSAPVFNTNKVGLQDLVMFCFQLEQLSSAGVPLLEGLTDVRESTLNPYFQKIIGAVVSEVEGGKMLSQALAEHPRVFSDVFVSLVRAGEQTGKLPQVFENLATTLKWQHELISQTKRLIAYPLFVLFVVLGAVVFLMIYLVPQMVSFLGNLGQELPTQTKVLIFISGVFVDYWWLLLALPIVAVLGVGIALKRSARFRYQFDYMMLHLPVTGPILHKIIMARFARYFALMYETGIPVLDAVKTCQDIVANRVVADALERAHQQINAGDSMSESFRNAGLFPPLVVRMIKVGENTGALDKSLANIGYFYDRDVNESIEKMLKLIEPALTVVLGGILAFIMFSVLGPVYDSFSKLKL
ncbi:MAG TPA: type II secretion system F family protein [Methylophilaceae bacterium]|nr:type II secretion system F family protein [Methylophilaceae bacterium]